MNLNLSLVFHTDGDFWFNNEDNLFDENYAIYKNAECTYSKLFDMDNEEVSFSLSVKGTALECKRAAEKLLGNIICNIRTSDYYMVFQISLFLINGIESLKGIDDDSDGFYYDNHISGNYEGTSLEIYASREDDKHEP